MSKKIDSPALLLRRKDAAIAMNEAKRNPWLCMGLNTSMLPAMLQPPPAWIPRQGEHLAARNGSLVVLKRVLVQPQTSWPWLLCALDQSTVQGIMTERPSSIGTFAHFGRRAFLYCALLCWHPGRSRLTVDEHGSPLRLITASDLARAVLSMSPKLSSTPRLSNSTLFTFRDSRALMCPIGSRASAPTEPFFA